MTTVYLPGNTELKSASMTEVKFNRTVCIVTGVYWALLTREPDDQRKINGPSQVAVNQRLGDLVVYTFRNW